MNWLRLLAIIVKELKQLRRDRLTAAMILGMAKGYLGKSADPKTPLASPLFADLDFDRWAGVDATSYVVIGTALMSGRRITNAI